MKKNRKASIRLFNSRNKWARRGRNLAHFSMSLIFYVFAYIFYGLAVAIKWLFSFLFPIRERLSVNRADLAGFAAKKVGMPDIKINVSLPDRFSRLKVLMDQLENKPIEENLDIGNIIDLTDGYSEADLKELVNRAAQKAFSRNIPQKSEKTSPISETDFLLAISGLKPGVNR